MAKLVNEYLAGQYPVGNNRLRLYDRLFAQKIFDSGVITTATGNPVSIVTNKAQNAISTLISFSPKQSGSGDPSPTNVRPIEGYNSLTLTVNGTDLTINLGDTYYGGVLDLTTGTLTINKKQYVFDGSEEWRIAATGTNRIFRLNYAFNPGIVKARDNTYICNMAILTRQISDIENLGVSYWFFRTTDGSGSSGHFHLLVGTSTDDVDMTLAEFKTMLTSTPMVVVADIQVPITYTLTPQTVALLKGNNTLATDGDELSITYKAKR